MGSIKNLKKLGPVFILAFVLMAFANSTGGSGRILTGFVPVVNYTTTTGDLFLGYRNLYREPAPAPNANVMEPRSVYLDTYTDYIFRVSYDTSKAQPTTRWTYTICSEDGRVLVPKRDLEKSDAITLDVEPSGSNGTQFGTLMIHSDADGYLSQKGNYVLLSAHIQYSDSKDDVPVTCSMKLYIATANNEYPMSNKPTTH